MELPCEAVYDKINAHAEMRAMMKLTKTPDIIGGGRLSEIASLLRGGISVGERSLSALDARKSLHLTNFIYGKTVVMNLCKLMHGFIFPATRFSRLEPGGASFFTDSTMKGTT